jgi:hypothetical protein
MARFLEFLKAEREAWTGVLVRPQHSGNKRLNTWADQMRRIGQDTMVARPLTARGAQFASVKPATLRWFSGKRRQTAFVRIIPARSFTGDWVLRMLGQVMRVLQEGEQDLTTDFDSEVRYRDCHGILTWIKCTTSGISVCEKSSGDSPERESSS